MTELKETKSKTKSELLQEVKQLLNEKSMYKIDGINSNSTKYDLMNAIKCLQCTDEEMLKYITIMKQRFPNIYNTITRDGEDLKSFLYHSFNRLYVYNTARYM